MQRAASERKYCVHVVSLKTRLPLFNLSLLFSSGPGKVLGPGMLMLL